MIVFFCYLFTSATVNVEDLARNITKAGGVFVDAPADGSIARHLESVQEQITLGGALFAAAVIVLSDCSRRLFHASLILEGTALFSLVAIVMDTLRRLEKIHLSPGDAGSIIFSTNNAAEASFVKDFLVAHEIKASALDENISRIDPFITVAVGGIRIFVPENQVQQATDLLRDRLGSKGTGKLSPFDIRSMAKAA